MIKLRTGIFYDMCNFIMRLLPVAFIIFSIENSSAQISIQVGSSVTENIDGIGTAATATVPSSWKVDKINSARTVGTYSGALTATEQLAGNSMSTTATAGIYNYGAGIASSATDRSIGFLSTGTSTYSGNLYSYFINIGTCGITSFTVSYNVEKYRMGTNTAGYSVQLYYSTNGSIWTSAGSGFLTSFSADASNNGYASAPGSSTAVTGTLNVIVSSGGTLYLAWNYSPTSGTTYTTAQAIGIDNFAMNNISSGGTQSTWFFRSVQSGDWAQTSTWESSADGATCWGPANTTPSSTANVINIKSPHIVRISVSVSADQILIDAGGTLNYAVNLLTLANGTGADLTINGTFIDSSATGITWSGSTWVMGTSGKLIRTSNTSSDNWQNNYNGSISTIPASSSWIIRKVNTSQNPVMSTTTGTGSYYPNFIIENNTASQWVMTSGSTFTGFLQFPKILGTLDIGGNGTNTVSFLNDCQNATAVRVDGDVNVRAGNILRNYGTGINLKGLLIVDGSLIYDNDHGRQIIFSGGNTQTISGSGMLKVYYMEINKSSNNVTLNRAVTVDNLVNFVAQNLITTSTNLLTLTDNAVATGASNSSFVNGPMKKIGDEAFTFTAGKNSSYRKISISAATLTPTSFWADNFGSGCSTGTLANTYNGWNITSTGTNHSYANTWYVSAQENGNGAGNCGSACGSNRTLHVGDVILGDGGARYFESGAGCTFCSVTNKRVESPVINCTGKSNIILTFNYIEFGEGGNDNATLWTNNGTGWTQLIDLPKTACCGGPCNGSLQGQWAAYTIVLPSSCNDNANVQFAFNWTNNGNGIGTDPAFAVDDVSLSVIPDAFTAEYFYANPQLIYGATLGAGLNHISACEYWILDRTTGTSNRNVTLSWDANSCGVTLLSDLRVARHNGTTWVSEGNTATAGTLTSGTVISGLVTSFSPFTLSSTTTANPLPIELVNFNAMYNGKDVDVTWTTASEINNDYFTVLRSADGFSFFDLQNVSGAGNSSAIIYYGIKDKGPLNGLSYYQLKQTDYDGTSTRSQIVPVSIRQDCFEILFINATADGNISVGIAGNFSGETKFEISDVTGRIVYRHFFNGLKDNIVTLPAFLSEGLYVLCVSDAQKSVSRKFAY